LWPVNVSQVSTVARATQKRTGSTSLFLAYMKRLNPLGLINKVYRATKRWDLRQALDHILSSHPQPAHHHSWATDHTGRV
jgi:hypothetical protein